MGTPAPEWIWFPPETPRRSRSVVVGSGHVRACIAAGATALVGTAVASWWLIGDQSVHMRPPDRLDYATRAPDVPDWVTLTAGVVGVVVVAAVFVVLIVGARRQTLDARWLRVFGLLAFAGFLVAAVGRTETAGVVGANIGGGIAMMFGVPVVGVAIVLAILDAFAIRGVRRG